jgi:hypothetical protein
MKKIKFVFLSSLLLSAGITITACGEGGSSGPTPRPAVFNFVPMFESGRVNKIFANEEEVIEITEYNSEGKEKVYSYQLIDGVEYDEELKPVKTYPAEDYITVEEASRTNPVTGKLETVFNVTPSGLPTLTDKGEPFEIGIAIRASGVSKPKALYFTIDQKYDAVNTGYNFASNTTKKAEILGKLEEYAMKNYLTGITLFENGGYVRYSPRVHILTEAKTPDKQYVPGYGFGLLTEGYLDDKWTPVNEEGLDEDHLKYLFSATSSDAGNIAGWDAQGSQVSDLFGYITSSFWSTRLKYDEEKQDYKYEWFPLLAKKVKNPQTNEYDPIPLDGTSTDTIHKKYRVYLKTDELCYNYMGANGSEFHRRHVKLEDYITTFQVLLTKTTGLFRGGEFASDDSYGLKGAYSYFNKTSGANDENADKFWKDMQDNNKIGIKGGHDENGDFIDFEFKNPLDTFTAKYVLSSNLYSPIPKDFLKRIGEGKSWINGAKNFGKGTKNGESDNGPNSILYNTLCLGPYYLERWYADQATDFKRDDTWFEYASPAEGELQRYRIPGVHLRVVSGAQTTDYAIYNEFDLGKLDSTGIPASKFQAVKRDTDLLTQGDATFKLNVNSISDQDTWDQMFLAGKDTTGKYSKVNKAKGQYLVKKWMGNKHFLNGLFWSIDRANFAKDRGVVPSTNFFSNAYLSDPVKGDVYNESQYHLDAQDGFDPELYDTLGYDSAKATSEFNLAISELVKHGDITLGTESSPTTIDISIDWMYQSDIETYGNDIVKYFNKAFNEAGVGSGLVKLVVNQPTPGANWELVYDEKLKVGSYDLGFGAISGNTLSPLNFMEVLKSDNSSLFTLNWGTDTSIVDPDDPIVFAVEEEDPEDPSKTIEVKKSWSYDAAWAAADHGSVIENGTPKDSVKFGYTTAPKIGEDDNVNRLVNGALMYCPFEFVDIEPGTDFEITRIEIALVGAGSLSIDLKDVTSREKKWVTIHTNEKGAVTGISINFDNTEVYETEEVPDPKDPSKTITKKYTFSQWINHLMFEGMHNQSIIDGLVPPEAHEDEIDDLKNPFSYEFYDIYWWIDVYYDVTIKGSVPTENYYSIKKTNEGNVSSKYAFVK